MMTVKAANYAKVLFSLDLDVACVRTSLWTIMYNQELLSALGESFQLVRRTKRLLLIAYLTKRFVPF